MDKKVKLKGHESFSIREGWLSKGIYEIKNDSKLFSRKDLTDVLGIGTNMVKSLKFWLQASNLIEECGKYEYNLSELGNLIYEYDLYLENIFSLYFIHINIVNNLEKTLIFPVWKHFTGMRCKPLVQLSNRKRSGLREKAKKINWRSIYVKKY